MCASIEAELAKYSAELAGRESAGWCLNKLDLLPEDEREARAGGRRRRSAGRGRCSRIAAIGAEGTEPLCWQRIMGGSMPRARADRPTLRCRSIRRRGRVMAVSRETLGQARRWVVKIGGAMITDEGAVSIRRGDRSLGRAARRAARRAGT